MMENAFLASALLLAIADWVAVAKKWRKAEYVLKPAVMLAILAWLVGTGGFVGQMLWFSLGILFSLVGDVLMLLPRRYFMGGMVFFLCVHLAYTIGLNPTPPPINLASLTLALLVTATAIQIWRRIAAGLRASGNQGLIIPALIYSAVLCLMVLSALLTLVRFEWEPAPAILVSGGGLLFMLSDLLLFWNLYIQEIKNSRLSSIAAYHLGQLFIVIGAAIHFSG